MEFWERVIVAAVVIGVAAVVANVADRAVAKRQLAPEAVTRYRVLRRTIVTTIMLVGILSALLVIEPIRAVAGGILASTAVIGLVVGFAAQRTLANAVAGVLIAFTQPLRIGDEVEVGEAAGTVEEIALTYTTIKASSGERFFIPNEKLASDTIRNSTIASSEHLVQIRVPVPLASDLDRVLPLLEEEARAAVEPRAEKEPVASVTDFETEGPSAIVTVQAWSPAGGATEVERGIRRAVHRRLRAEGIFDASA
ncbi:MAG: mechanosensitive ion channel family protein [Actinomycetota bacterium]|nr:mechanosensitive ion channel family protein [Actinomycetota bacterium]